VQLTIERLVAGGDALARADDGRVVFVDGALPGEVVEVEITVSKKDFARGRTVEVLEPSPDRVRPVCPHRRAGCGGCDWMHFRSDAQLGAKAEIVRESLRRIGRLAAAAVDGFVRVGGAVSPASARTSIRVVGGPGGRPGYRMHGSDAVVEVDGCTVAAPALERLLPDLRVAAGVELALRTSISTGAVTATWSPRRRGAVAGLPAAVHVGDRAWLEERVAGHDLRVSAGSFFQPGAEAAEILAAAVTDAAPELVDAAHAVDAYGGVGLFAVTCMDRADHVTLVESSASACRDAEANLAGRSARVVRSDISGWTAPDGSGPTPRVDVVVADPARSGLGRPGVTALAAAGADVFVLVSCDPVSMARDLFLLADAGYRPVSVEVIDLFPGTHHVETVTRLVRR
jgi:23S rRNA (uracil1939-C5)-methyltransferase